VAPYTPLGGVCEGAHVVRRALAGTGGTSSGSHERRRDLLDLGAPLEVSTGKVSRSLSAFVAGVTDRPVLTRHAGTQEGVGVHLSALGVPCLLSVAGAELRNRCVGLEERLGSGPKPSPQVVWACEKPRCQQAVRIADLAGRTPAEFAAELSLDAPLDP
jgi:hypothetical protein